MLTLMICLMVGWSGADGDQLDRGQTIALLRQLRAPILDYECIYEGQETRFEAPNLAGLPEPIRKATERDMAMNAEAVTVYQGKYAYRNDKSIHIDVSVRHPDPKQPLRREILCLFRNKGSKRVIVADRGGVERPDLVQAGGTIFVKKAFSQLRVDMYPYLLESISNDLNPFASAEWGDVDGHRCLVIDFPRLNSSLQQGK